MSENAFVNLTTDYNLKRMAIDAELVPAFKSAMQKIQKYFDEHGYSNVIDYNLLFETYALADEPFELKDIRNAPDFIELSSELDENVRKMLGDKARPDFAISLYDKIANYLGHKHALSFELVKDVRFGGCYTAFFDRIRINEAALKKPGELENIIIHEFIHFMIKKSAIMLGNNGLPYFYEESMVSMMADEISGYKSKAYNPLVKLVQRLNRGVGLNDYTSFLQGELSPLFTEEYKGLLDRIQKFMYSNPNSVFFDIKKVLADKEYLLLHAKISLINARAKKYESVNLEPKKEVSTYLGYTKEELKEIRENILARSYEYEEEMRLQAEMAKEYEGKIKVI